MTRIVFFGTPDYVLPVLDALKGAGYDIAAIVTQPPKPAGRKGIITPYPVAQWASKFNIQILDQSPKTLIQTVLKIGAPVAVLEAYGRIIPQNLINAFPKGIINVHPSLLPNYRGASPVEGAIAAGETETGVSIMKLDAEMDHGPLLAQFTEPILPEDNRVTLRKRLFDKAANVLVGILPDYLSGKVTPREQDHDKATFTTLMKKEMGFIPPKYVDLALQGEALQERWEIPFIKNYSLVPSAQCLDRFIRSVNPWPGAFTEVKLGNRPVGTRKLKILQAHIEELMPNAPPKALVPDLVQLEGKNPVSWKQFKEGYPTAMFSA